MPVLDLIAGHLWLYLLIVALLSLAVGSFLNVVIVRLPVMTLRQWRADCRELLASEGTELPDPGAAEERLDLVTPRSRCPHCGHAITALENIPVLSYVWLRGRCSACGAHISLQYPIVESATALLSVITAWSFGWGWPAAGALILTWGLIALAVIDLRTQLLPDAITLPLLWLGLLLNMAGLYTNLATAVIGATAGYLSLRLVYHLFKALTGKEGMGFGDFKLLAMLGAWMGWQVLPLVVLLSSLVGAAVGVTLILVRGQDRNVPIPYGPFLAAAGWLALLWGDEMIRAYWGLTAGPV